MLKSIQAGAYSNLDLDAPLSVEDLNAIIGANGAGESKLLEMIEFLPYAIILGLPETFKKRRSSTSVANIDRQFPLKMDLSWHLLKFHDQVEVHFAVEEVEAWMIADTRMINSLVKLRS